ncbi:protein-tyrosine phosphatase-like protein [Halteromyces radiatus]|uniref:protein-tyrosine phosphatase-like protein n=1 Tax=Halteromyces radiatus TaxID=101107 RepID=UPI00222094FC|nr:protein-tyrosine phosphatase-like protein [Halteromyces radiatus]KAI8084959.1 protein-tyrosine phosphatase-like protein [Halteromyces radiatus]
MVNSQARSGSPLGRTLSLIEVTNSPLRFLILDCPTESTLPFYMEEFKRYNVTDVVRCCQQTYSATTLAMEGITVHDMPFKDGGVPPVNLVREWIGLVDTQEQKLKENDNIRPTIAVHCVAGLGRAPVLVAIALIELGMEPLDAVEYIRTKRRGAFNKPQISYLDTYKRIWKTKSSSSSSSLKFTFGKMFKFGGAKKQELPIH